MTCLSILQTVKKGFFSLCLFTVINSYCRYTDFNKWVGGKYLSQGYIEQSYAIAEYAVSNKEDVQRVIDASPVIDKFLIQERVNAFFTGIERALNEK